MVVLEVTLQEGPDVRVVGLEEFLRRTLHHHLAVLEQRQPVCHPEGSPHVVRHRDAGDAQLLVEALHQAVGVTATSILTATGRAVGRAAFVGRLLGELEGRYRRYLADGFAALREEWESYSCVTGSEIVVTGPDGERRGRALGVDADGALMLRVAGDDVVRVLAGDVSVVDGYAPGRGGAGKIGD